MGLLGKYMLRLITGSLICSIVLSLLSDNTHKALVRLLCGMLLIILLVNPLSDVRWPLEPVHWEAAVQSAEQQAAAGEAMARDAQIQHITEAVESYILDKASLEGATLTVSVTLGKDLLPVGVMIKGKTEAKIQKSLSEMMEQELGIAKENQMWSG